MNRVGPILLAVALAIGIALQAASTRAQTPTLTVADRHASKTYTAKDLLAASEAREITIAHDPVYGRSMTYRAVPTAALLKGLTIGGDDDVQARATDNFSVAIPAALLESVPPAPIEAFLAVEDPAVPWPAMPGDAKPKASAGPFYIVWRAPDAARISGEYWTYHLAALTVTDSATKRWPALAVDASVPAGDPIRHGLDRFAAVCMACHKFNGAGEGTQGPDLGTPMNPVDYFQPGALRKLLRDPKSVRTWPDQKMPAFDTASLSDTDIDEIVAWLAYKTKHRP